MLVVIIEFVRRTVLSDYYNLTITNEPFHETQLFPFETRDDLFAFLSDDLAVIINDQLQPSLTATTVAPPSPPGRGQGEGPTHPNWSLV